MPFSGSTFTKLYEWLKDPQRNEKIFNSRLDDEFGGIATGLTSLAAVLASNQQGFLFGLTTSNNAANTKIDVAAGACRDSTNAQTITLASLTIDCGVTGANGLDAGSLANATWYHVFAIAKTDGTSAGLASTSVSAPTMPSGYTLKRRIGSFLTDGSAHIIAFTQYGDEFLWASSVKDYDGPGDVAGALKTMSVPTGVKVWWLGSFLWSIGSTDSMLLTSPDATNDAPDTTSKFTAICTVIFALVTGVAPLIRTNTSGQIRERVTTVSILRLQTYGWRDPRGRDS